MASPATRQACVLFVEDCHEIRRLWRHLLAFDGFAVREAADGQAGIQEVRRLPPDVILMDVAMPITDGIEATTQLKADPAVTHIPVIVVSGDGSAEHRARTAGCFAFLVKPVSHEQLLETIEWALHSRAGVPTIAIT